MRRIDECRPGGREILHPSPVIQQGHRAAAGAGQRLGRVQDALKNLVESRASVDVPPSQAEAGQMFP